MDDRFHEIYEIVDRFFDVLDPYSGNSYLKSCISDSSDAFQAIIYARDMGRSPKEIIDMIDVLKEIFNS